MLYHAGAIILTIWHIRYGVTTSEKTIGVLAALLRNVIIGLLASLMTAVAMGKSGVR